ncbi:MAG: PEP-CTERM sorting domain-containing protein [Planctomycetaceae bacterium]|nr:PEP-CTERM sorting domain-containing protein [Planctomycetaceae bacterium]
MNRYQICTPLLGCLFLLGAALSPSAACADIMLNEFLIEPSGPNAGQQFFELKGTANQSLSGISLLVLIGDPFASGLVDQVLDLSPFSLGSNGLLLHHDDPLNLVTPPDPGTTVLSGLLPLPSFFANVSLTFALVRDFTGMPLDDLDMNDDGILDVTPWSSVVDAVGIRANLPGLPLEGAFGTQLGFTDFPIVGFDPDGIFRDGRTNQWYASDVDNDFGGPYTIDPLQFVNTDLTPQNVSFFDKNVYTPGAVNAAVPEPSAFIALGVVGIACWVRRRQTECD